MLAIVIPTYNEEASIQKLIDELIDVRDTVSFDLIFVDDGSIDKSKEIIERNAKKYTWIRLLVHETNEGFAQSIKDGITFTLTNKYKYIAQMDCDLTHPSQLILKMMDEITTHDMIIASRYVTGGGMENVPIHRVFLSRVGNRLIRSILRIKTMDATSGYKLSTRRVFEEINLVSNSFQIQLELTVKTERRGFKIKEIPYILQNRESGASSFRLFFLLYYITLVFKLLFKNRSQQ